MAETYEDLGRKVAQTVPRAFRKQDDKVTCPKCGAEIDVPDDFEDDAIACPVCGEEVTIKAEKAVRKAAAERVEFEKIFAISKVEEGRDGLATAYGKATEERIDADGEIASYPETAEAYRRWSDASLAATKTSGAEQSLGNVRVQHDPTQLGGKVVGIHFDDANKAIWVKAKAATQAVSDLLKSGVLTGFSHGGRIERRWCGECNANMPHGTHCSTCHKTVDVYYSPSRLSELSYVDRPCLPSATFEYVKSDGKVELRKFAPRKGKAIMDEKALRAACAKVNKHLKTAAGHFAGLKKSANARGDTEGANLFGGISSELGGAGETFDGFGELFDPANGGVPNTPAGAPNYGGYKTKADADLAEDFFGKLAKKMSWDALNRPAPVNSGNAGKFFGNDK